MLVFANFVLCSLVVHNIITRLWHMDHRTRIAIRWSTAAVGAAAFAMSIAPIAWGMQVHGGIIMMEASIWLYLLACQRQWTYGLR